MSFKNCFYENLPSIQTRAQKKKEREKYNEPKYPSSRLNNYLQYFTVASSLCFLFFGGSTVFVKFSYFTPNHFRLGL